MKRKSQAIQKIKNDVCYSSIVQFLGPRDAIRLCLSCRDFINLHNKCYNKISTMMVVELKNKAVKLDKAYKEELSQKEKIFVPLVIKTLLRTGVTISTIGLYMYLYFLADSLVPTNHTDFFINAINPPFNCPANSKLLKITFLLEGVATTAIGLHVWPRRYLYNNSSDKIHAEYLKKSKEINPTIKAYQRFLEKTNKNQIRPLLHCTHLVHLERPSAGVKPDLNGTYLTPS